MSAERDLTVLKAKIAAFRDEVEKIIGFHEAWRPMVSDTALHVDGGGNPRKSGGS